MSVSTDRSPVTASERVSDVVSRDEGLIEVFVRHAPHFAKLRNRAMRRVMARLVTVEQAARMAGIDAARLVADLNAALGIPADGPAPPPAAMSTTGARVVAAEPPALRHPEGAPVREVDVREELRSGREPFSRIMTAVAALAPGEVIRLRAIFEPVPLYAVLGKRGFVHEARAEGPDDWSVWFWRPAGAAPPLEAGSRGPAAAAADIPEAEPGVVYLDVRGLEPPEPMVRTLTALESLPAGEVLVQVNQRVPQFLLPMLAERGFVWRVDEDSGDRVLVRIWRPA